MYTIHTLHVVIMVSRSVVRHLMVNYEQTLFGISYTRIFGHIGMQTTYMYSMSTLSSEPSNTGQSIYLNGRSRAYLVGR